MTATLSHDSSGAVPARQGRDVAEPVADVPSAARPRSGAPRHTRRQARARLLRAVPARRHLHRSPRPPDLLVGAGPDRQLRRARTDRPGRQPADGHAGPAGAHRVPQAGVPRLHPAAGRGGRAEGPRVRDRAHRAHPRQRRRRHRHRAVQAAAVDGRRALPRRARGGPRPVRRLDRRDRRGQHRRGRHRRSTRDARRRARRDDGVLHRAHRAAPRRAGGRHRLASGGRRRRCRRRHRGRAVDPGLHLHDGHRRQRHHHRDAGRLGAAAAPATRPAQAAGREPGTDQRFRRRVPAADLARPRCWAAR